MGKYAEAVVLQPYLHKNETFNHGISVLREHECRHKKCHKVMHHLPGISADTTTRDDNSI